MAVEREYRAAGASAPPSNVIFDSSGRYVLYPSPLGIKIVAFETQRLARLLGKVENTERFAGLALFQGQAKCADLPGGTPAICHPAAVRADLLVRMLTVHRLSATMIGTGIKVTEEEDPTLFCVAFKKSRFFLFTRREPEE